MTKTKPSESYLRYFLTRFLTTIALGLGLPLCVVLSGGLFIYAYMSVGEIRTSIDPALLPTAEYLYENPQQPPDFIQFDPQRYALQRLCYRTKTSFWTQIFLNGARVPPDAFFVYPENSDTAQLWGQFCLDDRALPIGLHLVEIHSRVYLWHEPLIYQWAVKVEEN